MQRSNAVIHGDNYTRLTNYVAYTLNAGMGLYMGKLISPTEMLEAKATLDAFFQGMYDQKMISSVIYLASARSDHGCSHLQSPQGCESVGSLLVDARHRIDGVH